MPKSSSNKQSSPNSRMWWGLSDHAGWNTAFEALVDSADLKNVSGSFSSSSSMGSRAFISESTTCGPSEEGKKLKVSGGAKKNHWCLYEILWNYCAITRALVSMKEALPKNKQHLHKICNQANIFNLELAISEIFERASAGKKGSARHAGRSRPGSFEDWDIAFILKCHGKEGAHAALQLFNQSCVDVIMVLDDSEKVVQILDYLIERVECGSLRRKLQLVLSVFLNYNASEKIVRKEFIGAVVKKNRKVLAAQKSLSKSCQKTRASIVVIVNPADNFEPVNINGVVVKTQGELGNNDMVV